MSKTYHFLYTDRFGKTRHIGMGIRNEHFQVWSRKGKGINPTIGLQESVACHVPANSGSDRYDREERLRLHLETAYKSDDVAQIQEALRQYTNFNWKFYKEE